MRGESSKQSSMLFLRSPETLVPKEHPIRAVKALADAALREMSAKLDGMYASSGRASIPPEWLLKGSLLMALYSVRSERMFCEQLGYNLLFRWFLDMDMAEAAFDASTFSKNRDRLMEHDVAAQFFVQVVAQARAAGLMSAEHFTVDGTLIEASLPRSTKSSASAWSTLCSTPASAQLWKRRKHVAYGGYRLGISAQGAPVRKIHRMPLRTSRGSRHGRPRRSSRTCGLGSSFS